MKKVYILIIAASSVLDAMAQSAPGSAPNSFNDCKASDCTSANAATCSTGLPNTTITFYEKQYVTNTGQGNNSIAAGAVWKFYNVATDKSNAGTPLQVNATITIENTYQAEVLDLDNNNAQDQNGNNSLTMRNLFSPTISADRMLTGGNRVGYVQFRIRFYKNTLDGSSNKWDPKNYSDPIQLSDLNYVHYDIDGVSGSGRNSYELRETGVLNTLQTPAVVTANSNTELNAYSYSGDNANWKGYMGSACNRDHTSQCSQVVASFALRGAYSSVAFRMGYNYTGSGDGLNDGDVQDRLYASTFGCFTFPQPITLPVKLSSFSGSYDNNASSLTWETKSEVNADRFEIERSTNASDYISAGRVTAQPGNNAKRYDFSDNLSSLNGNVFYYRLKMVDIDGKYNYSNVIVIRRDAGNNEEMSVIPNPAAHGSTVTIRITSSSAGRAEVRVIDLSGKIVFQQPSSLSAGTNSISVNNINLLRPGIYALQILHSGHVSTSKLNILQ